jgi:hypothetical protein
LSTFTYTHAYTRAEALVDQVAALYREGGFSESTIENICRGVNHRWLTEVGLYLQRDGRRVYEIEASINWTTHSDVASLDFSTTLPGWEDNASPEAVILGRRFAAKAATTGLEPHYWVLFTPEILDDEQRHRELCPKVGVSYGSSVVPWSAAPTKRTLPMQDLREVGLVERSTL